MMKNIKAIITGRPLLTVLILALAVRLVAVIYSQGFIQSDDFYDTVEVSYDWLRDGLWGQDGHLHWKEHPASSVVRFPLYTLFLYLIMKLHFWVGLTALSQMMYGIRLAHALLSLLPVWVIFKLTEKYTSDIKWSFWAAFFAAWHFAMPMLGVRNLIEMVGGEIWIVAVYFLYQYSNRKKINSLYWAGLFTGLAWMVRFQLAFAVIPIPILLWIESKKLRPVIHYITAVAIMLFLSALADKMLLGYWAASTINNLNLNTGLGTVYETISLLYPVVLIGFFIPPFSLLVVYLFFQKKLWARHYLLLISTLCFILFHSFHPNQQERFIVPVIPVFMFLTVMALWYGFKDRGYFLVRNRRLRIFILSLTLAINLLLLIPCTIAYGHRGLVEPLIWFERMESCPRVMFVQPGMHRWIPEEYAGYKRLPREFIRDWSDLKKLPEEGLAKDYFDYFVFYPEEDRQLENYIDSISSRYGPIVPVTTFEPSFYDRIFHSINPSHYRSYKAYVYTPAL